MLSISKIESLKHGLDYYSKDNYYSKKEQSEIEYTQWYGKAANELGLKGNVEFQDFKKSLSGISDKGKLGVSDSKRDKENHILYEKLVKFKNESVDYINNLSISEGSKISLLKIIDKLAEKGEKFSKTSVEKYQNNIFSILNKEIILNIEEKSIIKNEIKLKTEIFKKSNERRPGYDLTFSAPKSVSICALVGNDNNLIKAHREAVEASLKIVEQEYSQVRVRESGKSERNIETTGNIAVATFEHDVSRKKDPQLHTHCVVMNYTKKSDNSWRSIHQDGFFYDSKKIGLIYQNELAKRVKNLGYEIEINSNGTFDIKGYSKEQLNVFSKRTEQMNDMGAKSQKEKTKIVKNKRDKKDEEIPREVIHKNWDNEFKKAGLVHPIPILNKSTIVQKISNIFSNENKTEKNNNIIESVRINNIIENSMKDITANDVSFKKSKLEAKVFEKLLGSDSYNYNEIRHSINLYLENNTKIIGSENKKEYIPKSMLKLESETISIMQRGKNIFESIVDETEARKITDEIHNKSIADGFKGLNDGQRGAIELMLITNDRVFAWQGVAGAGKSFSLGAASKIAMEKGIIVKGFAPSAEAAKNLAAEAKLSEAHTVASLLVKETQPGRGKGNEIWIVDEAGLLSAADAHALLKKAEVENARLLLVGDTRQLSSVGAGNPFKQLQENGIKTAQLTQGIRQKDKTMKESVDLIADGKHKEGLEILDKSGKIFEVKNTEDIIAKMANDYLELKSDDVKKSLFISSTNYEKKEITNLVRSELKNKGDLSNSIFIDTYIALDHNEHALKYANVYNEGDIVILNKRYQDLKANQPYKILEVNHSKNKISIQIDDGNIKEINISKIKCNLFREEKIELCNGDRIKWTKNHKNPQVYKDENNKKNDNQAQDKRLNGQYLTVKNIDVINKKAVFEYENGKKGEPAKTEIIDLSKKQFLDYSYVTTVFSSQGKTCNKVYASLTNVDRENFYVAISRAEYDCKLYTKDIDLLYRKVEKYGVNLTAHEKIIEKVKEISKPEISKEEINLKHVNKEKSLKERLGNELALARLNRKIKESSFEIIHKLSIDPSKEELSKYYKFGKSNQEIISKIIHSDINKQFNIYRNSERTNLSSKQLFDAYKNISDHIPKIAEQIKLNLNSDKIENSIIQNQKQSIKNNLTMNSSEIKRKNKLKR